MSGCRPGRVLRCGTRRGIFGISHSPCSGQLRRRIFVALPAGSQLGTNKRADAWAGIVEEPSGSLPRRCAPLTDGHPWNREHLAAPPRATDRHPWNGLAIMEHPAAPPRATRSRRSRSARRGAARTRSSSLPRSWRARRSPPPRARRPRRRSDHEPARWRRGAPAPPPPTPPRRRRRSPKRRIPMLIGARRPSRTAGRRGHPTARRRRAACASSRPSWIGFYWHTASMMWWRSSSSLVWMRSATAARPPARAWTPRPCGARASCTAGNCARPRPKPPSRRSARTARFR
mmetsp:Transcript_23732/g.61971  ORF Transcript_23732/g.61971 Transcript_23732/m.61971 type:complete len:288 (-) Transcript_23732:173-1036(-)